MVVSLAAVTQRAAHRGMQSLGLEVYTRLAIPLCAYAIPLCAYG